MHFYKFLGLRTAEQNISKHELPDIMGPGLQSNTSDISTKSALSKTLGLRCAEQHVGNLKNPRTYGTPGRRTRRRKSQQNKTHSQKFWGSDSQNKTSETSNNALSEIMGLWLAEQHVGNLATCTFWNSGTPVRRTTRRKSQ